MEKKGALGGRAEAEPRGLPYVLTDIMAYFTMLVGIYFPSVTGEARVRGSSCAAPLPLLPRRCFSSAVRSPGSHTAPLSAPRVRAPPAHVPHPCPAGGAPLPRPHPCPRR